MISGTTTAALVGLSFAIVGSTIWGTAALPFLYGSTMGYGLGSWRWYHNSIIEAEQSLIHYPHLIRLHMLANFPWQRMLDNRDVAWYNSANFRRNWVMESMLVASWLSAKPALEAIHARREQKLVEAYGDADAKEDPRYDNGEFSHSR